MATTQTKKEEDLVRARQPTSAPSACGCGPALHAKISMPRALTASLPPPRLPRAAQDMLEEDDEFEEFETETWEVAAEDAEDQQLWQDDWDEDETENDFTQQLRAELATPAA